MNQLLLLWIIVGALKALKEFKKIEKDISEWKTNNTMKSIAFVTAIITCIITWPFLAIRKGISLLT